MKDMDTQGIEQQRKPVTKQDIAEAREALGIAISFLLSPSGAISSGNKTFYANLIMRCNIEVTDNIPGFGYLSTAGVNITDKCNFFINPHFFLGLTVNKQCELIIHEMEHLVYEHCFHTKAVMEQDSEASKENVAKLSNIAHDAVINIPLKDLTEGLGVTIERLNQELEKLGSTNRISHEDNSEVIYWKLRQVQEEMGEKLKSEFGQGGDGEIDEHGVWKLSDQNPEMAKATLKEAVNKAVESTGVGNLPSHIAKQIDILNKSLVDWKRQLQQFAVRTIKFARERTRAKRNRRTGILFAGSKKQPKVRLVVCCDSSGSVSNDSFTQFFSEIDKITTMGVQVTVIDADCGVAAVYEYVKGKTKVTRHGNGGTAYQPAISKAKELNPDGIIYFGDMDSADKPKDPKIPFLWAIVGTQKPPASFGKVVYVTDKR